VMIFIVLIKKIKEITINICNKKTSLSINCTH
jgi:hypothetical protein